VLDTHDGACDTCATGHTPYAAEGQGTSQQGGRRRLKAAACQNGGDARPSCAML
jgi:hypothetical protein